MKDLKISEMLQMQRILWEKYKDNWFNDVLLRYEVTPEEISNAYISKHNRNMGRDFYYEHRSYLK
ncbi:MAG: hypothetical protein FWC73_14155 [Defluviitaleaceae bacterium]|nr:hypothetical protein [Defluviitaleaceae bacterium]